MTDYSILSAIVKLVISDDMRSYSILTPARLQSLKYRLGLVIMRIFAAVFGEIHITRACLLADADTAAFRIVKVIILDYPTT